MHALAPARSLACACLKFLRLVTKAITGTRYRLGKMDLSLDGEPVSWYDPPTALHVIVKLRDAQVELPRTPVPASFASIAVYVASAYSTLTGNHSSVSWMGAHGHGRWQRSQT